MFFSQALNGINELPRVRSHINLDRIAGRQQAWPRFFAASGGGGRGRCDLTHRGRLFTCFVYCSLPPKKSTHENDASVWTTMAILAPLRVELCWNNATFKGPDREILDNFYLSLERNQLMSKCTVCSEALWCCCCCRKKKRKEKNSPTSQSNAKFTSKPHTWTRRLIICIYFHCCYKRLQSMSQAAFKHGARSRPEGIHFTEALIWVRGWMVGVGGGNWFDVSEAMPDTQWWESTINSAGGFLSDCIHVQPPTPTSTAITCNESNHLPPSQTHRSLNLTLDCDSSMGASCTLSLLFVFSRSPVCSLVFIFLQWFTLKNSQHCAGSQT